MTAPRTGGGVYRTLATIPHRTPTWLQRIAPLLPCSWALASFRWYRRAIGGHWERVHFLPFVAGTFVMWERTDGRCSRVHGKIHSPSYVLYECEDWPCAPGAKGAM